MSIKKRKRVRQKKTISAPVFILMFGGALLIAAGILFGVQGSDSGISSGRPALTLGQDTIQYGDVKFNTNLSFEIKVTNSGDGTLRFKEEPYIEVREGC
ncbi:MAG: hypothetical protein JSV42_07095 [Chloroflexota bacterium]|nr:MAG: hypothetical protein JSV42_07095 [Chloroflexota bacterium]